MIDEIAKTVRREMRSLGYREAVVEEEGVQPRQYTLRLGTSSGAAGRRGTIGGMRMDFDRIVEIRIQYPWKSHDLDFPVSIARDAERVMGRLYGKAGLHSPATRQESRFDIGAEIGVVSFTAPGHVTLQE